MKYAPASARTRMKLADSGKASGGSIRAEDRESGDCERKTQAGEEAMPSKTEKQEAMDVLEKNRGFR